jgi:hypothetical protein
MSDGTERVRLRAREGEAVEWTRRVAQRAGTLKDMMDDAPPEDGVYPVPMIAAAELAVLREMCEADSMPARLEQCSISELFRLVEGASFLDAPGALNHAQRALASRLNGKRADELTELLGATDGFGSAEERVAALAEPAFSPEGQLSEAEVGYAGGAPALQPQLTLWMAVTDDAKEVALGMVDVVTLAELKGVNRLWSALARRVLCSRLSRCEGQPAPTQLAEITDLNIKVLVDAGRPWEAAAAGRMLPSLARLRWEGFEVNVAAVRGVDLDERDDDEDEYLDESPPFLGGPAETALLSCIEGEGEPPLELLLAAVACAGSGEIRGIPVQMMRNDSVSELDLEESNIGVKGGMLLAYLMPVMGGLTSLNLSSNDIGGYWDDIREEIVSTPEGPKAIADALLVNGGLTKISLASNKLGEEGTKAICEALEQNKTLKELDISGDSDGSNIGETAGVKHVAKMLGVNGALTKIDVRWNIFGPEGAKVFADALRVNGGLTSLNLSSNQLCGLDYLGKGTYTAEGITAIADTLRVNGGLTSLDLSSNQLCSLDRFGRGITYTAEGITAIADALRVNGGLTALDLSCNRLEDEGVSAVCKAIQNNKETKLASLNFENNGIGPVGANAVAAMVAVTGALTVTNLLGNKLDEESTKMLAEVAKQKGISLCGIRRDQTTADFSRQGLNPPDALLLASDLSQAVVTGALTALDLSSNCLKDEGVSAVCAAIQSNKETKLASLNFYYNDIGTVGANAVAAMVAVTGAVDAKHLGHVLDSCCLSDVVEARVASTDHADRAP